MKATLDPDTVLELVNDYIMERVRLALTTSTVETLRLHVDGRNFGYFSTWENPPGGFGGIVELSEMWNHLGRDVLFVPVTSLTDPEYTTWVLFLSPS